MPPRSRYAPDAADRDVFACGPAGFMALVTDAIGPRVHVERFTPPLRASTGGAHVVTLARSGRRVTLDGTGTLLEQLERAGERPAHGCRIGICQHVPLHQGQRRRPRSGVRNDVVGARSGIRLCVLVPQSDLE